MAYVYDECESDKECFSYVLLVTYERYGGVSMEFVQISSTEYFTGVIGVKTPKPASALTLKWVDAHLQAPIQSNDTSRPIAVWVLG